MGTECPETKRAAGYRRLFVAFMLFPNTMPQIFSETIFPRLMLGVSMYLYMSEAIGIVSIGVKIPIAMPEAR